MLGLGLKLLLGDVFGLAGRIAELARTTIKAKVQILEDRINDILSWQGLCIETAKVVRKFQKARNQLLVFTLAPDMVEPTNNDCERYLRTPVIMRKVTNGFRAKWAEQVENSRRYRNTGRKITLSDDLCNPICLTGQSGECVLLVELFLQ